MFNKKTEVILLVYGKGGHAAQMKRFLRNNDSDQACQYVTLSNSDLDFPQIIDSYFCIDARDKFYWYKNFFISIAYIFLSIVQMIRVLAKYKVVGMVSTGPGLAVVPSIMCRMLFKKVVFFEDWCRFSTPSIAGRMMYLIADKFFIQQESLRKLYPNSIYMGRL